MIPAVDSVIVAAFALLAAGVAGSVLPLLPGPVLSLSGVLLYWWDSGFAEPSLPVLVALFILALAGIAVDLFGAALGARGGGASWPTTLAAAVVGLTLLMITGPVGLLIGVGMTVFATEFLRERDARSGLRAAVAAAAGVLASAAMQLLLTLSILVAMAAVVLL